MSEIGRLVPGFGAVEETSDEQRLLPGFGVLNEQAAGEPSGPAVPTGLTVDTLTDELVTWSWNP